MAKPGQPGSGPAGQEAAWSCGPFRLSYGERPLVMGILNVTPDSFSDGGCYHQPEQACARVETLRNQGADLIDVGGESTRPGAQPVEADEEILRILPAVRAAVAAGCPVSVDTMKAPVARAGLEAGACVINDVSAGCVDPELPRVVAQSDAGVVLMHMQGRPETMQQEPVYEDVVAEVGDFLARRVECFAALGVPRERILVDPGIGFGKTLDHNLALLRGLPRLAECTGCGVLVGLSRKRFLGELTGRPVEQRLAGTLAALAWTVSRGVAAVRVHDVEEACDAVRVMAKITQEDV